MTDTIHEVSTEPSEILTTPLFAPEVELVGLDDAGSDVRVARRLPAGILLRIAIFLVFAGLGALAMRWAMTYQGHGARFTPAAGLLIAAVVLVFGVPEVVAVVRHLRSKARPHEVAGE
jgi:hypothetical protein